MITTAIVQGELLRREGHLNDSMGHPIDPGARYNVEYLRYTQVTCIWRVGLRKPKVA